MWKKVYEAFGGTRGSLVKPDKLTQLMSLQSALMGAKDYKFEIKKNVLDKWNKWSEQVFVACCLFCV